MLDLEVKQLGRNEVVTILRKEGPNYGWSELELTILFTFLKREVGMFPQIDVYGLYREFGCLILDTSMWTPDELKKRLSIRLKEKFTVSTELLIKHMWVLNYRPMDYF